jgi:hypothetical protein
LVLDDAGTAALAAPHTGARDFNKDWREKKRIFA